MEKVLSLVQKQVQKAIDELVDSGAERGLQVSAYKNGKLVVDAVAGIADPKTGRPVTSDTPFYNYSIGKGATSTVAHVLAERGLFRYDTPVVDLWPEFGAHGKERVTVRHVLSHSGGVPGIPLDTTREDLCDWDKLCPAIADSELWWEPGTKIVLPRLHVRLPRRRDRPPCHGQTHLEGSARRSVRPVGHWRRALFRPAAHRATP